MKEEYNVRRTFMEDYNTGTFPHRKYYDLAVYEKKKALKASGAGSDEVSHLALCCYPTDCI